MATKKATKPRKGESLEAWLKREAKNNPELAKKIKAAERRKSGTVFRNGKVTYIEPKDYLK